MDTIYSNSYLSFAPLTPGADQEFDVLMHQDLQAQKVANPLFKAGILRVALFCCHHYEVSPKLYNNNLIILLQGHLELKLEGEIIIVNPGEMIFAPRGHILDLKNQSLQDVALIRIKFNRSEVWNPIDEPKVIHAELQWTDLIYILLRRILFAYRGEPDYPASSSLGDATYLAQLLRRARNRLVRKLSGEEDGGMIGKLQRAIRANPQDNWSLKDMAKFCHTSARTLHRSTHFKSGVSPTQMVIQIRMQAAKTLLATTDKNVQTIAEDVGYQSLQTFIKQFKKFSGYTPGQHRKIMNEG